MVAIMSLETETRIKYLRFWKKNILTIYNSILNKKSLKLKIKLNKRHLHTNKSQEFFANGHTHLIKTSEEIFSHTR